MATPALISGTHKMFAIPYHQGLANIVPGSREFDHPAHGRMVAIPHTRETTRLARNHGIVTPAPILSQYDWNGDTPFRTQMTTAALLTMNQRAFVLSEMGTGKTRAALHAANFLILAGEIRRVLVVAPLSTLAHVWDREIMQHFNHLGVGILHGSREQRLKVLAHPHDVYVINHDGIETIQAALIKRLDIQCVIIDELAVYRNAGTNRWKAASAVIAQRKFVWGMTGSPTPNEPADAWAQVKLLLPQRVPKYFKAFQRLTMTQVSQFKWVPRAEAKEVVHEVMQPAVRYKRDDCVELPETSYITRTVTMSAQQARVYKDMMAKLQLAFQEGQVTAANEGVLYSKLLQISCGYVYTKDKQVVTLDNSSRLDALKEILDEAEGKVIVFAEFTHAAVEVHKALVQDGVSAALITGATPAVHRSLLFSAFQDTEVPRVLVAHPKCMAHGLTLTAASVIVWFGPTTSLETFEQACARITRPGQTRKTVVALLTGSPIEAKTYKRLQTRASTQGALLELFEGETA